MLPQVVLVHQEPGGRGLRRVDGPRREVDLRQVLEHASRLDGVRRIVRPDERAVVRHQRGPDLVRREAQRSERLDNHEAGVAFVVGDDLGLRHRARHRHVAAEVVGVRRVETPDRQSAPARMPRSNFECVCTMPPQRNAR